MRDKDELLRLAERLYTSLASQVHQRSTAKRQVEVDDNLLKKFAQYYIRHHRDEKAFDSLLQLLDQKPPKRGGGLVINWEESKKILRSQENVFRKLHPREIQYILGWTARIAKYRG